MDVQRSEFVVTRYDKIKYISICIKDVVSANWHQHNSLEIGVVLNGAVKVWRQDGEVQVDAGGLLLFNAYEAHAVSPVSQQMPRVLYVQISNAFSREYLAWFSTIFFDGKAISTLPSYRTQQLRRRIVESAVAYFQESTAFQLDCFGRISLILADLLREVPHKKQPVAEAAAQKNNLGRLQRISDYVEQNYKRKLTLSDLAKVEGVSTAYMSRVFGQLFRVPFQEYLKRLRLDKALPLLRDPSVCLVDVCLECGFSDTKYLNAVCQQILGCSALAYRRGHMNPDAAVFERHPEEGQKTAYTDQQSLRILQQFQESMAL